MENKQLRVAIIGGGIGGLSLALSISKLIPDHATHLEIDIYESTSSLRAQVGAGLGVWPNSWAILETLGVGEELAKHTTSRLTEEPADAFLIRKADLDEGRNLFRMRTSGGGNVLFHRADFQGVLLDFIPSSIKIHTKKRLHSYTQTNIGVELRFEDDTVAHANLVVGADGIQSRVRKCMVGELSQPETARLADPSWTGSIIYRCVFPRQRLVEAGWTNHRALSDWIIWMGKNASIMTYPVRSGECVAMNINRFWPEHEGEPFSQELFDEILRKEGFTRTYQATQKPIQNISTTRMSPEQDPWADNGGGGRLSAGRGRWACEADSRELGHSLQGFEPEVQAMLNAADTVLAWAVHTVGPLKTFVDGNVCLLGDAAHALDPHQGAGAGQAIIDSYVLANLLASVISNDPAKLKSQLKAVLEVYDAVRRPCVAKVAKASRESVLYYFQCIEDGNIWRKIDDTNGEDVKLLQEQMTARFSYAWDKAEANRQVERGTQMLLERI